MAKITDTTLAEIETEYAKWSEFLNIGVGLLSFSLGISCLGTPIPGISALLSLLFMLIFIAYGRKKHYPAKLRELRKATLVGIDEVALLGIKRKYFGLSAIFRKFPVFLVGWFFLGGVAGVGPELVK